MGLAMVRSSDEAARHVQGGNLQSAMIDEVFANATEEQALSFFAAAGARLAAAHPLPEHDGVAGLEQAINEVWHELGLGHVALAMAPDGITIDHQGYAANEASRSSSWPRAAGAVLRGAYGAWFQAIGGETKLHARLIRETRERILLHYGL